MQLERMSATWLAVTCSRLLFVVLALLALPTVTVNSCRCFLRIQIDSSISACCDQHSCLLSSIYKCSDFVWLHLIVGQD